MGLGSRKAHTTWSSASKPLMGMNCLLWCGGCGSPGVVEPPFGGRGGVFVDGVLVVGELAELVARVGQHRQRVGAVPGHVELDFGRIAGGLEDAGAAIPGRGRVEGRW